MQAVLSGDVHARDEFAMNSNPRAYPPTYLQMIWFRMSIWPWYRAPVVHERRTVHKALVQGSRGTRETYGVCLRGTRIHTDASILPYRFTMNPSRFGYLIPRGRPMLSHANSTPLHRSMPRDYCLELGGTTFERIGPCLHPRCTGQMGYI